MNASSMSSISFIDTLIGKDYEPDEVRIIDVFNHFMDYKGNQKDFKIKQLVNSMGYNGKITILKKIDGLHDDVITYQVFFHKEDAHFKEMIENGEIDNIIEKFASKEPFVGLDVNSCHEITPSRKQMAYYGYQLRRKRKTIEREISKQDPIPEFLKKKLGSKYIITIVDPPEKSSDINHVYFSKRVHFEHGAFDGKELEIIKNDIVKLTNEQIFDDYTMSVKDARIHKNIISKEDLEEGIGALFGPPVDWITLDVVARHNRIKCKL